MSPVLICTIKSEQCILKFSTLVTSALWHHPSRTMHSRSPSLDHRGESQPFAPCGWLTDPDSGLPPWDGRLYWAAIKIRLHLWCSITMVWLNFMVELHTFSGFFALNLSFLKGKQNTFTLKETFIFSSHTVLNRCRTTYFTFWAFTKAHTH